MELSLGEIAEKLGARLLGDGSIRIRGVAGIREAGPGEITFLANSRYNQYLGQTKASAVIVHESLSAPSVPALFTANPYLAFLQVLQIFDPGDRERPPVGLDPTAVVAPDASLGQHLAVGPHVVIREGAEIGDRTVLMAGTYVGPEVRLGMDCVVYPNVVLRQQTDIGHRVVIHAGAVIGDDGFGFAPDGDGYRKIPQLGRVVIEDDVEIGANATVDRATTGVTRIGRGSRLDNLVMIAHNVEVGENSILCAQVGISGSVRMGRHVTLGGQAGVIGHITIGDGVKVGAQGGVTKSIPPGESYSGYPAQPHMQAQRSYAALRNLPGALRLLHELERRLQALERRIGGAQEP